MNSLPKKDQHTTISLVLQNLHLMLLIITAFIPSLPCYVRLYDDSEFQSKVFRGGITAHNLGVSYLH